MAIKSESTNGSNAGGMGIPAYLCITFVGFLLLASLVLCVWWVFGEYPIERFAGDENVLTKAAQLGDSYGYINSLLTGLALAAATLAIILQSIELRYQRSELQESQKTWRDTAAAQRDSHAALKEQAELMEKQSRFMLLAAYLNAISGILQDREAEAELVNSARAIVGRTVTSLKSEIDEILGGPVVAQSMTEILKRDLREIIGVLKLHKPLLDKLGETDSLLPTVLRALEKARDDYSVVASRVPAGPRALATDGIQSFCGFVDKVAHALEGSKTDVLNHRFDMQVSYNALENHLKKLEASIT